jgi:hypothetical protein
VYVHCTAGMGRWVPERERERERGMKDGERGRGLRGRERESKRQRERTRTAASVRVRTCIQSASCRTRHARVVSLLRRPTRCARECANVCAPVCLSACLRMSVRLCRLAHARITQTHTSPPNPQGAGCGVCLPRVAARVNSASLPPFLPCSTCALFAQRRAAVLRYYPLPAPMARVSPASMLSTRLFEGANQGSGDVV